MKALLLALSLLLPAAACAERILVIGDSVAASHNHGLARVIGQITGADVTSHARGGASISPVGARRALGPIPDQIRGGPWDWIVIVAGANDLLSECRCGRCAPVIDSLVSADGQSGEAPDLVARARATGARVVWADYYTARRFFLRASTACLADWQTFEARTRRMAARLPGVRWVDMSDAMDPRSPADYARDELHPSQQGTIKIGRLIAEAIRNAP